MTDEELRDRILDLAEAIRVRREKFVELREAGKDADADVVRNESRALFREHHGALALEQYRRTVPLTWTHDSTEPEIERAIKIPALVAATKDCATTPRNVAFLGPTGVGKTTALGLLVRRFYIAQRTNRLRVVRWVYARDLAASVLEYALGAGECPEVRLAREAPVLVLDDLGLEKDHGPLLDVLNERYEGGRLTWVSSGLTVPQLRDRYGEAFFRRLVDVAGKPGLIVSCFQRGRGEGSRPESRGHQTGLSGAQ